MASARPARPGRSGKQSHSAGREEVLAAFHAAPLIAFVRMADGVAALNSTIDLMQHLGRPRGDMWEVAFWEDKLTVQGSEAYYAYQVDNTTIVVPETIDATRALTRILADGDESIRRTDTALDVRREFLVECA